MLVQYRIAIFTKLVGNNALERRSGVRPLIKVGNIILLFCTLRELERMILIDARVNVLLVILLKCPNRGYPHLRDPESNSQTR